jgi:hypothetical protein
MPAIPVRLHGANGRAVKVIGLIDSGADCACFPVVWADLLGVDLALCTVRRGSTAGGSVEQYYWEPGLRAEVAGQEVRLTGVFTSTPVALLGRNDFFRIFRVDFDERSATFALTRYDDDQRQASPKIESTPSISAVID